MRKGGILQNPIIFVLVIVTICCMFVLFISVLKLPDPNIRLRNRAISSKNVPKIQRFGEMIIEMLPKDLGFTIFLPSEKAFERDLRLKWNESFARKEKKDEDDEDTFAILSRVLGFSAVPRTIHSYDLMYNKEINYDSLSGYVLYIQKDSDGKLMVNGVRSEWVDLRMGKIIVHLMDGVLLDAEFEQSVKPENLVDDSI